MLSLRPQWSASVVVLLLLLSCSATDGNTHLVRLTRSRIRPAASAASLSLTDGAGTADGVRRFAILQADEFPDAIRQTFPGGYSQVFLDWLRDAGSREQWTVFRAFQGQLPAASELASYTAFVVTGSKHDAHGDEPWVQALRSTIQAIRRTQARLLGVCFGAQIISIALGGQSGRGSGWELGFKPIEFARDRGVLASIASQLAPKTYVMEYHQDQIKQLPPDALLLASSPNCVNEMYQIPATVPSVLAVQFHPEFSEEYNRASLAYKRTARLVPEAVVDSALSSLVHYAEASAAPDAVQANPEPIRDLLRKFVREGLA